MKASVRGGTGTGRLYESPVETLGKATVKVTAFRRTMCLYVRVVKKNDTSLVGLDWCRAFGLRFLKGIEIYSIRSSSAKDEEKQFG
ncbi:hypothetical protein M514_23424 [Trichuris suis]|uniref:Uncharacterized protein n=1 Tax=Trichuris suis TaxID=68888 RepID=A0A085N4K4_9BILA|nr:hypothetical protein M514_23424 [Trichuris suis]